MFDDIKIVSPASTGGSRWASPSRLQGPSTPPPQAVS
jgi:hypothetical protein